MTEVLFLETAAKEQQLKEQGKRRLNVSGKGREQRELADDHPIKAIYTRRMNTITQYLRRDTLNKQTAAVMKRLAKKQNGTCDLRPCICQRQL